MAAILNIKNLFKNSKESHGPFKHHHYLNTLSAEKIDEIILFSESDRLCEALPDFQNKRVLFLNDERHKFVFKKIVAREPDYFINLITAESAAREQGLGYLTVFGDLKNLPFKHESFDIIVCPLALSGQGASAERIKNLSHLLKNGGRLIVSTRHPQLEYLLCNQNPSQTAPTENSATKYFRLLRENHLFTEDLVEGLVDLSLKPFFSVEGEYDYYHDYKGTPISLIFKAVKYVRGKPSF